MRKKASVVVGLGYGDEGKGLVTDFLSLNSTNPLVIRYNGGHQAGHTVVMKVGDRHVFSNFGAGTLRGIPTYWSRYCTFSPSYLLYELDSLPLTPRLHIDKLCPVTTHYDVLFNRALEIKRGKQRLGSCGVGFGATIDRHFANRLQLYAIDLLAPQTYQAKLKEIRTYYRRKLKEETNFSFDNFEHDKEDWQFSQYVEEIYSLKKQGIVSFTNEEEMFSSKQWESYVFEGAQGILLDRTYGNKPYVTKSNTTSKNAIELLQINHNAGPFDVSMFYVSRAYLTRHGNGPFKEFSEGYTLHNTEPETNVLNEFQGQFKKGFLDLDFTQYALACDSNFSGGLNKSLVITCMDQLPDGNIYYYTKNELKEVKPIKFPMLVSTQFNQVFFSFHPYSEGLSTELGI